MEALQLEARAKALKIPQPKAASTRGSARTASTAAAKAKAKAEADPPPAEPTSAAPKKRDPAKKIISLARTMEDESPGSLRGIKFLGELDLGHAEARLHQLIYDWKLTVPVHISQIKRGLVTVPMIRCTTWFDYILNNKSEVLCAGCDTPESAVVQSHLSSFWGAYKLEDPNHDVYRVHGGHLHRCVPFYLYSDEGRGYRKSPVQVFAMESVFGIPNAKDYERVTSTGDLYYLDSQVQPSRGHSFNSRFLCCVMPHQMYKGKVGKGLWCDMVSEIASDCCKLFHDGVAVHLKSGNGVQQFYGICLGHKGDFPALIKAGHLQRSFQNLGVNKGMCPYCDAGQANVPWEDVSPEAAWVSTMWRTEPWSNDNVSPFRMVPCDQSRAANFYKSDPFHIFKRRAFIALYEKLPASLEDPTELVQRPSTEPPAEPAEPSEPGTATEPSAKRSRARSSKASQERLRMGEINAMHNNVIQKLRIQASRDYKTTPTGIAAWKSWNRECKLTWRFYDSDNGLQTEEVTAVAPTKPRAKAMAHEQMLLQQNQMPKASEAETEEMQESSDSTRRKPECVECGSTWSLFLPSVLRAVLGEGERKPWPRSAARALMHELLDTAQSHSSEGGFPVDLWESLLDEASFAVRHYFMALPALRQIAGFSLNDAFPGPQEKEYFQRFRNLLALERHGGLMSGIQTYELDPKAACSVPTLEVHLCEADRIALSSPPESNILELVEGARPLRASDLVLLVPSEAAEEVEQQTWGEEPEMGNSTGWQHPEAWLASVSSITGNPRMGEEVRLNVRRISDFAADVELKEGGQRLSPITVGRNFKLFFLAMETPMDRQLTALRCLTRVKLPAWSENYESKPSYQYLDDVQKLLVAGPEEAVQKATAAARGGLTRELAENNLERLARDYSLIAALTPSQNEAVLKALEQRLSLVQGPPGTGKTQVACAILAAWASIHAPMGEKILAVADSNVAADNIYVRLQRMGIDCTRVGQGKEVEGLSGESMYREVQRAKILVATCIGSGMEVLTKTAGEFRRVLVDECTQACEPSVLVPLGRHCEQVVLIGDHAQLPATVLSKAAASDGLGLSLFERMAVTNGLEPSLLLEQRRMHSSIADFPNEMFYAGQLVNAADDVALEAVPGFPWPNPDCRVAFVDVASSSGLEGRRGFSAFNTAEAEAVAETLERIINAGYPPNQIVVLTAYLAQKQELRRAIENRGLGQYLSSCHVDTIDGYQGMEQGLVLFSATRSNESNALGFLADNRRMNVMLTRAKQGLIVFGNAETLRNSASVESKWPAWLSWIEERNASVSNDQLSSLWQQATTRRCAATLRTAAPRPETQRQADVEPSKPTGAAPTPPPTPPTVWQQVYSAEHKAYYYWNQETNLTQWEEPPSFKPPP
ncbi:unnamed protein product [Durusdinium trenchii]|uniref:WW domain-containing protein n=1 Tax=Durusdinium trenchii TaxID=1381693 RepID=A0ABP0N2I4_9DINO